MADVAVFGLSSGEETALDLANFTNAFQVSFPILPDAQNTAVDYRQTGGTSPYPLDYIIDQTGRITYIGIEYDPDGMVAVIDQLLAQPAAVGDTPIAITPRVWGRPNPFNPRTEIRFTVAGTGPVTVELYDSRGRLVRRLLDAIPYEAGDNGVFWDGNNDAGQSLPTGLYLVRLRSAGRSYTGKLTLVR